MKKTIRFAFLLLLLLAMQACSEEDIDLTVTIQFDTQGGNTIDPITINVLEYDEEFETPIKEGYKFISWSLDLEGEAFSYDFKDIDGQVITLYAVWEKQLYDLIFMDQDETILHQESIQYGEFLEDSYLEAPTKLGYTFNGWDIDLPNMMPEHDVIAKATYIINRYRINFETNGSDLIEGFNKDYNETFTVDEPTREGHAFLGWFSDHDFETPFTEFVVPAHDVTLYAKWEKQSYEIIFKDYDGNLLHQETVLYDEFLEDSYLETPTRLGYTFNGWDIDLPNKMPAHDVVATATYSVNRYRISFETYEGSSIDTIEQDFNTQIEVDNPTYIGHQFLGWFLDETFEMPFNDYIVPAEDITLYAKWEKQSFTITFDSLGGDFFDAITASYMDPIELPIPEILGYQFEGWYIDYDYSEVFDSEVMGPQDIHLVAKWKVAEYQVVYYLLGGTNHQDNPLTVDGSKEVPLYEPSMAGFTFVGWYLNHHFSGDPVTSIEKGVRTDIELHAKWQLNQHQMNYVMIEKPMYGNVGILNPGESIIDVAYANGMYTLLLTSEHRVFEHERHTIGRTITTKYPVDMTSYFDLLEGEYITNIYAGDSHGAVLTSHKRLFMWGSNEYGQMALPVGTYSYGSQIPIDITEQFPLYPTEEIDLVALGGRHTIVTTTHGRIFTFGLNDSGQLGVANNNYFANRIPIEITLAFNLDPVKFEHFKYIYADKKHSMVITSENRIFVFGENEYGALGTGVEATHYEAPYEITDRFNFLPNETIVIARMASSSGILVTSENRIFTWGDNGSGQLGLSNSTNKIPITEVTGAITLYEDEHIVDASTGYLSMLLTSKGRLFITGNRDLLIGLTRPDNNRNTFAERTSFIDLKEGEIITKVYNSHNIAASIITSKGNILSWGQTHRLGMGDHPKWIINMPSPINLVEDIHQVDYYFTEVIDDFEHQIEGYQFLGWFSDSSLETPFDLTNMPDSDVIVYGYYMKIIEEPFT